MDPRDSSVRHSRQIVGFDPLGRGWAIRASADENSPPPHAANNWMQKPPKTPRMVRSTSPVLPPLRALQPIQTANERALQREIAMLENKLASVERAFMIQSKLVDGFCKLRVASP